MALETLLLVEDDELLATQTRRALERHGLSVTLAADAEQARQCMASLPTLDAAVLDQNLGVDNGLDLIAPLLTHFPQCRILVLTGYASIATTVDAIKSGADNYLPKPADADQILRALDADAGDEESIVQIPDTPMSVNRLEWEHIQKVLHEHEGNISATARALGMHRRTLQRKLAKHPVRR
jgi:two-component system response regulator RegA